MKRKLTQASRALVIASSADVSRDSGVGQHGPISKLHIWTIVASSIEDHTGAHSKKEGFTAWISPNDSGATADRS